MIWPTLPALLAPFFGVFLIWFNWGWWRDGALGFWEDLLFPLFFGIFFYAVFIGALSLAGFGLGRLIGDNCDQVWAENWRGRLVSLRSADGIQGSIGGGIFLVSGYIESRQVYYYYTDDGPNRYKPHRWFPDENTTIIEEDRVDGEVIQYEVAFKNKAIEWFGIAPDRYRMDFHIPRGSLKQQFSVE